MCEKIKCKQWHKNLFNPFEEIINCEKFVKGLGTYTSYQYIPVFPYVYSQKME